MEIFIYMLILACGLILGMMLHPFLRMINLESIDLFLDKFGSIVLAPFASLAGYFRKKSDSKTTEQVEEEVVSEKVDPREQQISDSAQTIRSILLTLATAIHKTDKAAINSSLALTEVRNTIDNMPLPADLVEAHSLLMHEIDLVISSNTSLKNELANSEGILADQRKQIESLQTAVRIDGLTQLANRSYFDEKLTEMIKLVQRYNEPFCLMMIDIDHFKSINDSYGHLSGDRILKGVTYKIKELLRGSDFLARYGGDEFALILIKTGSKPAMDVAWKLCNTLRESRFLLDGTPINVTLSIGVAEAGADDTEDTLLKRADTALYRVKDVGRNNVLFEDRI